MYYTLATKIDGRRFHVCKLEQSFEEDNVVLDNFFTFIVPSGTQDNLLTFEGQSRHKILLYSGGYDFDEIITSIGINENDDNLNIYINDDNNNAQTSNLFKLKKINGEYKLGLTKAIRKIVNVTIHFKNKNSEIFKYTFRLSIANETCIIRLALDFGSEASQAAYLTSNQDKIYINLFEQARYFHTNETKSDEDYAQFDKNDINIFKSIFLLNLKKSGNGINPDDAILKPSSNHHIRILSIFSENRISEGFIQIPNTKLAELATPSMYPKIFESKDDRNALQIILICQLLHLCFDKIIKKEYLQKRGDAKINKIHIKLSLLIPNVYPQEKIYKFLKKLNYYTRKIIESDYEQIKSVEILTLSESDASFKGYHVAEKDENKFVNNKSPKYLVIDSGKGTTDFSVIEKVEDSNAEFRSIFKAGLPASGQYISYAVLEVFLEAKGVTTDKFIQYIKQYTGGNLLRFIEGIDNLKSSGRVKFEDRINSLNNIGKLPDITELTNIINDIINDDTKVLYDTGEKVHKAIALICDHIIDILLNKSGLGKPEQVKFDRIYLTGRAFRYKPYLETLKRILFDNFINDNDERNINEYIRFFENDPKKICIEGALNTEISLNYSSDIAGALILKRNRVNNNRFLKIISPNRKNGAIQDSMLYKVSEDFYNGLDVNNDYIADSEDTFWIGNARYKLNDIQKDTFKNAIVEQQYLKINLEPKGYLIRFKNQSSKLLESSTKIAHTNDFFVKSAFPYINNEVINQITLSDSNTENLINYIEIVKETQKSNNDLLKYVKRSTKSRDIDFFRNYKPPKKDIISPDDNTKPNNNNDTNQNKPPKDDKKPNRNDDIKNSGDDDIIIPF